MKTIRFHAVVLLSTFAFGAAFAAPVDKAPAAGFSPSVESARLPLGISIDVFEAIASRPAPPAAPSSQPKAPSPAIMPAARPAAPAAMHAAMTRAEEALAPTPGQDPGAKLDALFENQAAPQSDVSVPQAPAARQTLEFAAGPAVSKDAAELVRGEMKARGLKDWTLDRKTRWRLSPLGIGRMFFGGSPRFSQFKLIARGAENEVGAAIDAISARLQILGNFHMSMNDWVEIYSPVKKLPGGGIVVRTP